LLRREEARTAEGEGTWRTNELEKEAFMKVAVTAQGGTLQSELDPRFGRAGWFIIVDTESGDYEAMDNSEGVNAPSGAGVASGQRIVDSGAEVVITGRCGPNAERILTQAGIRIVERTGGTVEEAVESFKKEQ
jgi:predicted Fe-Mo cluster-binding NifX family protein